MNSGGHPDTVEPAVREAMRTALAAAEQVRGTTSPNPPVGCVVLDASGLVVGTGATRPPGGVHAEVEALHAAGTRARGGTAVVTLEPCTHTGRTPPCTDALRAAGVSRVVYAAADPNPQAGGGSRVLAEAGVDVRGGVLAQEALRGPLRAWSHYARSGRPHVTWKYAASLDGRVAAADGSSQWISSEASRTETHGQREHLDAILVGTGTVLADDPRLTARTPEGGLAEHQPLRVVVGHREVPRTARVFDETAPTLHLPTRDPHTVLEQLAARGVVDLLLEGGPTLAGAFLASGCVDRLLAYVAPVVLGAGTPAVVEAGVASITQALRWQVEETSMSGPDMRISAVPDRS